MGSVVCAEFEEDVLDAAFDRLLCDRKLSPDLLIRIPSRDQPENLHLAFPAADNATVDAFHHALVEQGYRDNGGPGERDYHPGYYGAFVLDPDGNNVEVVCHNRD